MHEMSLAMALIDQVEKHIAGQSVEVESVKVAIGVLSGVEVYAFDACYPLACEGTRLSGSRLEIEDLPVKINCAECKAETELGELELRCKSCGSWDVHVISGREFLLKSIEVRDV